MNISNSLSISRIILAIPIIILLLINKIEIAIGLGVIAGITDFLDGYLARKLGQVTELGKIIDPIADKVFIGLIGIVLVYIDKMPLWFLASIIGRDLLILIGGMYARKKINITLTSTFEGKATYTIILLVTLGLVLDNIYAQRYGTLLALSAMAYTFFQYMSRMFREIRARK